MTDTPPTKPQNAIETGRIIQASLKRRHAAEVRFKYMGRGAIAIALAALCMLLGTIITQSISAFRKHEVVLPVMLDAQLIDPEGTRNPQDIAINLRGFYALTRDSLEARFPEAVQDRRLRNQLSKLVKRLAVQPMARDVAANPALIGGAYTLRAPVSDNADLYLKGAVTDLNIKAGRVPARIERLADGTARITLEGDGFAGPLADVRRAYAVMAAGQEAEMARIDAARIGAEARVSMLDAEIERVRGLPESDLAAFVDIDANEDRALAALAGRVAGGDLASRTVLQARVAARLTADAETLSDVAEKLDERGTKFARRAARELEEGRPGASNRQVSSRTAYAAADQRRAAATGLLARAEAVLAGRTDAVAEAEALLQTPLKGLAPLALALHNGADRAGLEALIRARAEDIASFNESEANALDAQRIALEARLGTIAQEGEARLEAAQITVDRLGASAERLRRAASAERERVANLSALPDAELEAEARFLLEPIQTSPEALAFALGREQAAGEGFAGLRALALADLSLDLASARRDVAALKGDRALFAEEAARLMALSTSAADVEMDASLPSFLVEIGGGTMRIDRFNARGAVGPIYVGFGETASAAPNDWRIVEIVSPTGDRMFTDAQIAWVRALDADGAIQSRWNTELFTSADSNEPELAGALAAMIGSFWTMLVTMVLAVPIGVMAAIYLEEFAPRNRLTQIIEININNLAAVPSIVFGLLGAAVFINFFGMARSIPLVGGMVLALMTLPTVIIASRAALKAVPPSIREAALGVGASKMQSVFHHVLPLAAPGILTGSIIGMAQALGETAPLLLIGMVAFVADVPEGPMDSSTVLPVLIFQWATRAFRAWEPMTAAAILILLVFMVMMNAFAVYLRRRFERRW
jgi:phosphate ABC transporter permease subunit PstA